ncbi:MAG: UDP-2,4-diacetamido-2,4,6-trideoxy-beta-L-altropyranose hydrolase [Gemmatimonadetes bacterium]|nr:UDP-2,4-diacetamido-2,4,6-trideoxy-beta-L-altropyranose hydrolase [Gemmatimonadota bacterium]
MGGAPCASTRNVPPLHDDWVQPVSVIIRVDASAAIGAGHLMRCIALAQALKRRDATPLFVTRTADAGLLQRLRSEGFGVVPLAHAAASDDSALTIAAARLHDAEWIVVDGYDFDPAYLAAIRTEGRRILYIDDLGGGPYECDVVLNQNLHALETRYAENTRTRLLLGPTYALLRKEFGGGLQIDANRASNRHPHILITMGGADPEGCTPKVIEAIAGMRLEGSETRVIAGPAFQDDGSIERAASQSTTRIEVLRSVDNMVEHMLWADRCVTAGGSTCWECCRLALPMAVGSIALNQVRVAASIESHRLGVNLGWLTRESANSIRDRLGPWFSNVSGLRRAAKAASELVDGRGADRVAEVLLAPGGRDGGG